MVRKNYKKIWDVGFYKLYVNYGIRDTPGYHEKIYGGFPRNRDLFWIYSTLNGDEHDLVHWTSDADEFIRPELDFDETLAIPEEQALKLTGCLEPFNQTNIHNAQRLGFKKLILHMKSGAVIVHNLVPYEES